MSALDDIVVQLNAALPALRTRFAVRSLAVFGSRARGAGGPESDVDVLVRFDPGARVSLFTLAGIQTALEDALGAPVDVVHDHPGLRASFRKRIEEDLVGVA